MGDVSKGDDGLHQQFYARERQGTQMRNRAVGRGFHPPSPSSVVRALCFVLLVLAARHDLGQASDEEVKLLFAALASDDCESRLEGISRYSRSEDNERHRNGSLRRLSTNAPPPLREQVVSLMVL